MNAQILQNQELQNQDLRRGEKVFYYREKGTNQQIAEADMLLTKQTQYTIKDIESEENQTYYILKEFPFIKLNALLFRNYFSQ